MPPASPGCVLPPTGHLARKPMGQIPSVGNDSRLASPRFARASFFGLALAFTSNSAATPAAVPMETTAVQNKEVPGRFCFRWKHRRFPAARNPREEHALSRPNGPKVRTGMEQGSMFP